MIIVNILTSVLNRAASNKLKWAEKRNQKAIQKVKDAKENLDKSSFQYGKTQADVLIQLTKLNKLENNLMAKRQISEKKSAAIDQLINEQRSRMANV